MTYLLNLLDLCFTLCGIQWGIPEGNPLLRNTAFMVVYKVLIIGALCWWLNRRSEPIARYGLKVLTAVYGAVNVWHVMNLIWR